MNQHQPDYRLGQWRPMVERISRLLDRQTSGLHYWFDNPDDLSTLWLIWYHYRDCWAGLVEQQQEPLLLDFCQRQADQATQELAQWYLNVEGAFSNGTLSAGLSELVPWAEEGPVSKKGRGNHSSDHG